MPRNNRPDKHREVVVWRNAVNFDYRREFTPDSKTAVSIPDAIFRAVDRHARKTRKTRSQLYTEALSEYLSRSGWPPDATQ
jgi:hypothetical protein